MKILYLSDTYAQKVRGTKISIFKEMKKRGVKITFENIHSAGNNKIDGTRLLKTLQTGGYTHLWVSHTWSSYVGCTLAEINRIGVQVLGFGFSDPYGWKGSKLKMYNIYSTNHLETFNKLKNKFKVIYMPTACDVAFHTDLEIPRTTDILVYGCGIHPRFKPNTYRLSMMKALMRTFKGATIKVFGRRWKNIKHKPPIMGKAFLNEINRAKVSIDLQQDWAPLAHRMFECMACGTPVLTRKRGEVRKLLPTDNEIMVYTDFKSLAAQVQMLLDDETRRNALRKSMYDNTRRHHNIDNRIDVLLNGMKQ